MRYEDLAPIQSILQSILYINFSRCCIHGLDSALATLHFEDCPSQKTKNGMVETCVRVYRLNAEWDGGALGLPRDNRCGATHVARRKLHVQNGKYNYRMAGECTFDCGTCDESSLELYEIRNCILCTCNTHVVVVQS